MNSLTVVQNDYPIGAHTVTQSTAHIKGSKIGVSQISRDYVEEEGGDTEEEIKEIHLCTREFCLAIISSTSMGT